MHSHSIPMYEVRVWMTRTSNEDKQSKADIRKICNNNLFHMRSI